MVNFENESKYFLSQRHNQYYDDLWCFGRIPPWDDVLEYERALSRTKVSLPHPSEALETLTADLWWQIWHLVYYFT